MNNADATRAESPQRPEKSARRRAERARKKASAPFFFGKQAVAFAAVCVALIVLDLFLYIGIAIYENTQAFGDGSPKSITLTIGDKLKRGEDGIYTLHESEAAWMDREQCWAMLLSEEGEVLWNRNAPETVLHPYTLSEVAVFSRTGYLDDFPCFVCKRDDGLLVTGFPKDSYAMNIVSYLPQQSMAHVPLYVLFIFLVDAAVLYLVYMVSKRRVTKSIAPMIEALDELACGRPVHVQLKGSLRDVGETINAASAAMRRKDEARRRWVSGVSHDVRTPLAISMGHAERIAKDETASDAARESARIIERQNSRIRDLVSDLNIASKLEYDMQPIDVQPVRIARLVRNVAADYANTYIESPFSIEAEISETAHAVTLPLDERLIDRALRNLANNAIRHNEHGCTVRLFADADDERVTIGVADNGTGLDEAILTRLNREARDITAQHDIEEAAEGPTPPPHFIEYHPEKAAAFIRTGRISPAKSEVAAQSDAHGASEADEHRTPGENSSEAATREKERPTLEPKDLAGLNEHGLGLSLVARIAAAHGGQVEFSSEETGGFCAAITFPLSR